MGRRDLEGTSDKEKAMIDHELLEEEKILVVTPRGALEEDDFTGLAGLVDPFIEANGDLKGLMIYSASFPGWENFAALISHLKFVRQHHRYIEKVAAVTDSGFLSVMPKIADHFLKARVKHFDYGEKDAALTWLAE